MRRDVPEHGDFLPEDREAADEARRRLSRAGEQAMQGQYERAACDGIAEHEDDISKARGRALERVALQEESAQGPTEDLNEHVYNFPVYDMSSPHTVASVKCRGLTHEGPLNESDVNAYIADFELAAGHKPSDSRFQKAAQHLHELARDGKAVPREMADSPEAALRYLQQHGELRIPADHVAPVQQELRRRLLPTIPSDADPITQHNLRVTRNVWASRLGLNPASPTYRADVERQLSRIKGLPIRSDQIRAAMDDAFR